jgi:hypothetical protein
MSNMGTAIAGRDTMVIHIVATILDIGKEKIHTSEDTIT